MIDRYLKLHEASVSKKIKLLIWQIVWWPVKKFSPRNFHLVRIALLKSFGADVKWNSKVYPHVDIYDPSNLIMKTNACISPHVDVYNVAKVILEDGSCVSQYSFICTATHNYKSDNMETLIAPVHIGKQAWIMSKVMVGPGVNIGSFAVVKSGSFVYSNVPSGRVICWPAKFQEKDYERE